MRSLFCRGWIWTWLGWKMTRGVYPRTDKHREAIRKGIRDAGGRGGERNANWRGGKTKHELYRVYMDMVGRCHRPTHPRYSDYGGRGIQVCAEWRDNFWTFVRDVGERPPGKTPSGRALYSLDRIDNDGDYEPGNVRWATPQEQLKNTRPRTPLQYCRRGHAYDELNTYRQPDGSRRCRKCSVIKERNRSRRNG